MSETSAIDLTVVMRNEEHCLQLLDELRAAEFKLTRVL